MVIICGVDQPASCIRSPSVPPGGQLARQARSGNPFSSRTFVTVAVRRGCAEVSETVVRPWPWQRGQVDYITGKCSPVAN
jgi:hypothetical protein